MYTSTHRDWRKWRRVRGVLVVLAGTERVKELKNFGAGAYIRKPYVLERIGVVVKAELDK